MGTDSINPNAADKGLELSQAEAQQRIKKLELENQILEGQTSTRGQRIELLKAYTSIGGLITAGVAALAFLASLFQISENFRRSDASFEAERFGKALTLLSESRPAQRLTGVTYLASLLPGRSNYQTEAADTLANMLGLEENAVVRRGIRDALVDYMNLTSTKSDNRTRLQRALVQLSKTMVSEYEDFLSILQDNCNQHHQDTAQEEGCQARERLDSIAFIIESIVRKDTDNKNLSSIYCASCDFTNLKLDGFDFTGAILLKAVFDGASLNNTSFKNANLSDARFRNAFLRGSNFEVDAESYSKRRFRVKPRDLSSGPNGFASISGIGSGPDFTCADLSEATFKRHPVFWVHSSEQTTFFADHGPSFWWANLTGTDFSYSAAFGVTNQDKGPFKVGLFGFRIGAPNGSFYMEWYLSPDSSLQIDENSPYWPYIDSIEYNMVNAQWKNAKIPDGIRILLERAELKRKLRPPKSEESKWYGSGEAPDTPPEHCIALQDHRLGQS